MWSTRPRLPAALLPLAMASLTFPAAAAPPSLEQERPSPPGPARWLEDYRFLDDPAKRSDPFDALRYHRLSENAWLQLGGEARYRMEELHQPVFGLRGVHDDSSLMQRLHAHADLHLLDDRLRAFLEMENTRAWGRDLYSPAEDSRNEIHQAFVDINAKLGSVPLQTRLGRQEMALGSQAWVTWRDFPNVRMSYDGLRLSLGAVGQARLDAFAFRPVRLDPQSFDNGSDNDRKFYGLYATLPQRAELNLDLYAFGLETKGRSLNGQRGDEKRYTLGNRLYGQVGQLDYSWDFAWQTGHLGNASIRAWAVSSDSGYTFKVPWQPRLGMRIDAASGDRHAGDGRVETFDPLYPKAGVYGESGLVTLANAIIVGPTFAFSPLPRLRIDSGLFKIVRQSDEDAVYIANMGVAVKGGQSSSNDTGSVFRSNLKWRLTDNLTADLDYQYYAVGSAIRDAGGVDSQFTSLRATFKF